MMDYHKKGNPHPYICPYCKKPYYIGTEFYQHVRGCARIEQKRAQEIWKKEKEKNG